VTLLAAVSCSNLSLVTRGILASLGVACALLLLSASPVVAQQSADQLVDEGLSLREQGHDAQALVRFEAAYELDPSPRTLAQIALAEMALTRWLDAERHLLEAMQSDHEWIQRNQVALNGALAGIREHIGRLQVEADQEGAVLFVDGEEVGTLPLAAPITRLPGEVTIEVRADGFTPEARTVTLTGGQVTREVVRLRPVDDGEGPPDAEGSSAVFGEGEGDSGGGGGVSIPGVILIAGGGAALVTGAVLLGVAFAEKASLEDPDGMPTWTEDRQAAADQVPILAGAGEVLLGVGVAALAVGVILMVVDGGGDDSQARIRDGQLEVRF